FDHDVPDDLSYLLGELTHEVTLLRKVLPEDASDESVFSSHHNDCALLTCNRDDFLQLAKQKPHHGIIVVVRRRNTSGRARGVISLLDSAGEAGLKGNINFA